MDPVFARSLGALPVQVAPAPETRWVHDQAQESKYGSAYLTELAERCDAFIEEQTKLIGWTLEPGTDVVDLTKPPGEDPDSDATIQRPRLADLKDLNRKRAELAEEINYVDNLEDLPEKFVIAYKARQAAKTFLERK